MLKLFVLKRCFSFYSFFLLCHSTTQWLDHLCKQLCTVPIVVLTTWCLIDKNNFYYFRHFCPIMLILLKPKSCSLQEYFMLLHIHSKENSDSHGRQSYIDLHWFSFSFKSLIYWFWHDFLVKEHENKLLLLLLLY